MLAAVALVQVRAMRCQHMYMTSSYATKTFTSITLEKRELEPCEMRHYVCQDATADMQRELPGLLAGQVI